VAAAEAAATTAEEAAAAAETAAALAAEMEAAMADVGDVVTAVPASVDAAGLGNGNAHNRRLERRAAEHRRQREVVERRQQDVVDSLERVIFMPPGLYCNFIKDQN
jgi:hypothetical protein